MTSTSVQNGESNSDALDSSIHSWYRFFVHSTCSISFHHTHTASYGHVYYHLDRHISLFTLIISSSSFHRDIYPLASSPIPPIKEKTYLVEITRYSPSLLISPYPFHKLKTYMLSSNPFERLDGFWEGICRIPSMWVQSSRRSYSSVLSRFIRLYVHNADILASVILVYTLASKPSPVPCGLTMISLTIASTQ